MCARLPGPSGLTHQAAAEKAAALLAAVLAALKSTLASSLRYLRPLRKHGCHIVPFTRSILKRATGAVPGLGFGGCVAK